MAPTSALARRRVATRLTRSSSIKQREEEESEASTMSQDIPVEQDTTLRQSTSSASSIIDHGSAMPENDITEQVLSPVASTFSSSMASSRSKRKASDDASSLSKSVRQRRTSNNNNAFHVFQEQDGNISMSLPSSPSIQTGRKGSLFMSMPASSSSHLSASFPHSAGPTFDVSVLSPPSSSTYHYPTAEDYAFFPGSARDFPLSAPAGLDAAALQAWNAPYAVSFSTPPKQSIASISAAKAFNLTPPDEQQYAPFANSVASTSDDAMSLFASQVRRQTEAMSLSEADPMPDSPSTRLAFSPRISPPQAQASPSPSVAKRTIAPLKRSSRSSVSRSTTASSSNGAAVPPVSAPTADTSPVNENKPKEKRNHNKKATPGKINRPPNAWILYRSDRLKELKGRKEIAGMPQATLSQLISHAWHSEPNSVRDYYNKAADRRKAEHMALHPDYKYNPRQNRRSKISENTQDRNSTPSPDRADGVIPHYRNPRSHTAATVNDAGDDSNIPVPDTPIGEFQPSFDPALLGLPEEEGLVPPEWQIRACPPSPSPVKQASTSSSSRHLSTPLRSKSRIPVPVSRASTANKDKAELFKQNASSFAQQQGLKGSSRASPSGTRGAVPSASPTPSRVSQAGNSGFNIQDPAMRLSTPAPARERSFAKSPSLAASKSRAKTVPRYQQPTASSMARSVTHPPVSTSYQQAGYAPISPTAVEQANIYPHIQHPVPRPVHGSETFMTIEEMLAGLTNAPPHELLFQETTNPYEFPSLDGTGLASTQSAVPAHQLYQTPEGIATVAGNLGGEALQYQARGAYDQFQQNHIFTFYPAQAPEQAVQLVQQPQLYQQAPPQMPMQARRTHSSPRKVSASMRAHSQQPMGHQAANNLGLSASSSTSMHRANSSPAAPIAMPIPPPIPHSSSGNDGYLINGVLYPFTEEQKVMAMAYQEPSTSNSAALPQQAIQMLPQPGVEYILVEQNPEGYSYQTESFPNLAQGVERQGNDSFEQYLNAPPPMREHQPISAMLPTPDTGSTGFQSTQYLVSEESGLPFLNNLDEYGLPSAASYIADYGGSLPPSAIDPSFQPQDGQNAPTMFIAETGKHYSLNNSIGSNGSGENFSTVDPNDLTIIEHLSSDSLVTDISA